ncbi:hypothetical protein J2803_000547 [Paraburkholderia phenoliruptrix]|nr:hypothetical protein [Paraburkholderia phenoliruptrix]
MGALTGSGGSSSAASEPGGRESGERCEMAVMAAVSRAVKRAAQTVFRNVSMTRNPQERRTPEQIRASNRRLGLVLLAIAAVFFAAVIVNQGWFS